jgi:hypothetical protein
MATSFQRQAAALRQGAADPQTDLDLARIMLETATDLENAGSMSAEDEAKHRQREQLFPLFFNAGGFRDFPLPQPGSPT